MYQHYNHIHYIHNFKVMVVVGCENVDDLHQTMMWQEEGHQTPI